jgi:ribosomal protein L40E
MSEIRDLQYQCPTCKAANPWRPEAAGRPVDCACGELLFIPFSPGTADKRAADALIVPPQETTLFPTDDAPPGVAQVLLCPDCGATMTAQSLDCDQCGYRRPRPKRRIMRRRAGTWAQMARNAVHAHAHPPAFHFALELRPIRDVALPILLAAVGFFVEVALLARAFSPPHNWEDAIAVSPLLLLLAAGTVGIVFLIAVVLSPLLDLSLGPIAPLAVKLAAASLFPAAVGTLVYNLSGRGVTGGAIGWMAVVILYLTLFRVLFDFDWPDALLLIALVCLAHAATLLAVLWPLTHGPLPMRELWVVFAPMIVQSALTFCFAGGMIAPHFGEA